jgi:hypothetical protein
VKVSSVGPECQIMVKSVTNCVGSERFRLGVRPQRIDGTQLWPEVSQGTCKDKKAHVCVSDQWLSYVYIAPGASSYNGLS